MKTTLEIASSQLKKFFFSPIAWVILLAILIQIAYNYCGMVEELESWQLVNVDFSNATRYAFTMDMGSVTGIYKAILDSMYLFLPLLSMGVISADMGDGSVKLMFSSPIKTWQFVLGKYLATAAFSLLIIGCLTLFLIPSEFIYKDLDYPALLCASIGVLLLSMAYMSIGLFISSLSSNQIVVAVTTFIILGVLSFADRIGQGIPFLGDAMFWIALPNRAQTFVDGLFSSMNFFYFLIIIIFFTGVTYLRLLFSRQAKPLATRAFVYVAFGAILMGMASLSTNNYLRFYKDFTNNKRLTLSKTSQKIIEKLGDEPIDMEVYANLFDANVNYASPSSVNFDKRQFEKYVRFLPQLDMNYHYFYAPVSNFNLYSDESVNFPGMPIEERAMKASQNMGVSMDIVMTPEEARKLVDLNEEDNQFIRVIEYKGKKQFLRMFDGYEAYPREENVLAVLRSFVMPTPKVVFLSGNGERSFKTNREMDYKDVFAAKHTNKMSLLNLGFSDMTALDTRVIEASVTNPLLEADILVIADPKLAYSEKVLQYIIGYIEEGRDMLLTVEPDANQSLNPVIESLGLKKLPGSLRNTDNSDFERDLILANFDTLTKHFPNPYIGDWFFKSGYPTTMPGSAGFEIKEDAKFEIQPLLVGKEVHTALDSLTTNPRDIPILLSLERQHDNRRQRIWVSGDADFLSTKEMDRRNIRNYNDKELHKYMFYWLTEGELPLYVTPEPGPDDELYLAEEPGKTVFHLQLVFLGLVPLIVGGSGTIFLIKRNRN